MQDDGYLRDGLSQSAWSPNHLLVADDHALFADALCSLIQMHWPDCAVSHVADAHELFETLSTYTDLDGVLLDLRMPGMETASSIQRIVEGAGGVPVILMSGLATASEISEAFDVGIAEFIPKSRTGNDLVAVLIDVLGRGGMPLDRSPESASADNILATLSRREVETALHMARGQSNKEIALSLNISPETVKVYSKSILKKFSVRNRTEFAIEAVRRGLVAACITFANFKLIETMQPIMHI
jgi:DNA-binding NarL/FixJ family response regulator